MISKDYNVNRNEANIMCWRLKAINIYTIYTIWMREKEKKTFAIFLIK